jgi:hypothetical protein
MRQVIYVATTPGRVEFITNFLQSVKKYYGKYPIFIESCYEYGWFDFALHHEWDELLFLHDSCEIKDYELFDIVFEQYKEKSVSFTGHPYFLMGLGKFLRDPYIKASFPTKNAYMDYKDKEYTFGQRYLQHSKEEKPVVLFPDFMEPEERDFYRPMEHKFGRRNIILENKYIKKYKGHWTTHMLYNLDKNGFPIEL